MYLKQYLFKFFPHIKIRFMMLLKIPFLWSALPGRCREEIDFHAEN